MFGINFDYKKSEITLCNTFFFKFSSSNVQSTSEQQQVNQAIPPVVPENQAIPPVVPENQAPPVVPENQAIPPVVPEHRKEEKFEPDHELYLEIGKKKKEALEKDCEVLQKQIYNKQKEIKKLNKDYKLNNNKLSHIKLVLLFIPLCVVFFSSIEQSLSIIISILELIKLTVYLFSTFLLNMVVLLSCLGYIFFSFSKEELKLFFDKILNWREKLYSKNYFAIVCEIVYVGYGFLHEYLFPEKVKNNDN